MTWLHPSPFRSSLALLLSAALTGCHVVPKGAAATNQVAGTWRMVTATIDPEGEARPAYGAKPSGMLVFTTDMHYVEVLTAGDTPRFASNVRGAGTDAENRAAMGSSIGMFGTYTVDADGAFLSNQVVGATYPNWVGNVNTPDRLRLTVKGDRMYEEFRRPDGTRIAIVFERVR